MIDWDRYKALQRQERALMREHPATVTIPWEAWDTMRHGIMLLRRYPSEVSDLQRVDEQITVVARLINKAFDATPGVRELREEQQRLLNERQ